MMPEPLDDAKPIPVRYRGASMSACPHIVTSDEGTSYCDLAESTGKRLAEAKTLLRQGRYCLISQHKDKALADRIDAFLAASAHEAESSANWLNVFGHLLERITKHYDHPAEDFLRNDIEQARLALADHAAFLAGGDPDA